jgi:hypothetical protein
MSEQRLVSRDQLAAALHTTHPRQSSFEEDECRRIDFDDAGELWAALSPEEPAHDHPRDVDACSPHCSHTKWGHPRLGVAALREAPPRDFGEQTISEGAMPDDLKRAIEARAALREEPTGIDVERARRIEAAAQEVIDALAFWESDRGERVGFPVDADGGSEPDAEAPFLALRAALVSGGIVEPAAPRPKP